MEPTRHECDEETDNGKGNDEIQGFFGALRMTVVGVMIKESQKSRFLRDDHQKSKYNLRMQKQGNCECNYNYKSKSD